MSVYEAAQGSRLTALIALRDALATRIDEGVGARDLAAVAKQLGDVLEQIEILAPPRERNAVDDIAARRALRRNADPKAPGKA